MSVFKDNYTSFLKDIEENIKNKEDLEYIKKRFEQFYNQIANSASNIENDKIAELENRLKELEEKQNSIDEKMEKIEEVVSNIEKDIYSEEGFDFEIVCPYCNYEFVIDVDDEKTEVECPECNNVIELDWSGDLDDEHSGCHGGCSSCHGCDIDEDEDEAEEDDM
mgnify:FL=1